VAVQFHLPEASLDICQQLLMTTQQAAAVADSDHDE
jgi:hypothetical protein